MRILYLTHRLPYPPDKGERIRAFHQLRWLAAGHEIDLICFADSVADASNRGELGKMLRSIEVEILHRSARWLRALRNLLSNKSMSCGFFYSRSFAAKVRQAVRERDYDLIFVYCSSMAQFVPDETSAVVAIDFVDADSQKFKQYSRTARFPFSWIYAREARTLAAFEAAAAAKADLSIAGTERDASDLRRVIAGPSEVHVVANGIEVPPNCSGQLQPPDVAVLPFAVFVGTMDYLPNVEAVIYFARRILPIVRRTHPQMQFVIVGRNPTARVRRLAKLPGVVVTGFVPDVYAYLRRACVAVAPFTISQGFHFKIAEALAVGTPVLATTRAAAGIDLSEEHGLYCADDPREFAARLIAISQNPDIQKQAQQRAVVVRQKLSWQRSLAGLERLLREAKSHNQEMIGVAAAQEGLR